MVTSDGVDVGLLREEQEKLVEHAVARSLARAIWDNRGMRAVGAAVGTLDPRSFDSGEEFAAAMAQFLFLDLARGPLLDDVTMLGKRSPDAEQLNSDVADLVDAHGVMQAFGRGEEVFQAAWGVAQSDQRGAFVRDAQRRASELREGVMVYPWMDGDMIGSTEGDTAASRVLLDEVERYAMESARIIGTTHRNGAVDSSEVLASWENSGLTWSGAAARANV